MQPHVDRCPVFDIIRTKWKYASTRHSHTKRRPPISRFYVGGQSTSEVNQEIRCADDSGSCAGKSEIRKQVDLKLGSGVLVEVSKITTLSTYAGKPGSPTKRQSEAQYVGQLGPVHTRRADELAERMKRLPTRPIRHGDPFNCKTSTGASILRPPLWKNLVNLSESALVRLAS